MSAALKPAPIRYHKKANNTTKTDLQTAIKTAAMQLANGINPQQVAKDLTRLATDIKKGK